MLPITFRMSMEDMVEADDSGGWETEPGTGLSTRRIQSEPTKNPLVANAEKRAAAADLQLTIHEGAKATRPDLQSAVVANAERRLQLATDAVIDTRTKARQAGDAARRLGLRLNKNPSFAKTAGELAEDRVTRKAMTATQEYVQWVISARKKLKAWTPDGGEPPVTGEALTQKQKQAVMDGANVQIVSALTLNEPDSLIAVQAEKRLFESILGTV